MLFFSRALRRNRRYLRMFGPFEPTCISAPYSGDVTPPAKGTRSPDEVDRDGYASAALAVKLTGLDERRLRRQAQLGRIATKTTTKGRLMFRLDDVIAESKRKPDTYGREGKSPWRTPKKPKKPNNPKPLPKTGRNSRPQKPDHPWFRPIPPKATEPRP